MLKKAIFFIWIIQILLNEGGISVNLEDNDKATPLHTAAQAGQTEVIRKLVSALEVLKIKGNVSQVLATNIEWNVKQ